MITLKTSPGLGQVSALLPQMEFSPCKPQTLEETGVNDSLVESLICKHLAVVGNDSGRAMAEELCLSLTILEERFQKLAARQILTHKGSLPLGDYVYVLTERGRELAHLMMENCAYRGAVPVPFNHYVTAVDAQTIRAEAPRREQLEQAFQDISVSPELFARLGPAVNSGAGLFLYGAPGNGKSTLAERITLCFGHEIWIPKTILAEGEIIKLYDPAYHQTVDQAPRRHLLGDAHDNRWIKIRRPTVIVGGELTMDSLEIRHNPRTSVSEAPLQMKSNCGSLLIDDFGRQRLDHRQLLNRWIVPLEKRYDFLTLASGKKIQVPFDQLIIFSTNLDPRDLVDEAFLRRIPYKIQIPDPTEEEFHRLFAQYAPPLGFEYNEETVEHLLEVHYHPHGRQIRRCHPRDLLLQVYNYCIYNDLSLELKSEYLDMVVDNYFTVVNTA